MPHYGFIKTAAVTPRVKVADTAFNASEIIKGIKGAYDQGAQIIILPELAITSYSAGDLFVQRKLLANTLKSLKTVVNASRSLEALIAVGAPLEAESKLFNAAVIIKRGHILGIVPKTYLPNYKEFYEARWFNPAHELAADKIKLLGQTVAIGNDLLFRLGHSPEIFFAAEICEDLWMPSPPSSYSSVAGAHIIANLSASPEAVAKSDYRGELVAHQSARVMGGYIYTSSGVGESTTDLVYGGHSLIAENGRILAESEKFKREGTMIVADIDIENLMHDRLQATDYGKLKNEISKLKKFRVIDAEIQLNNVARLDRFVDPHPFVPRNVNERDRRVEEIFNIQSHGLAKRLEYTKLDKLVLGLSGGLDSTLALLVSVKAMKLLGHPSKNIYVFSMPGFGTTVRTKSNAEKLARSLGVKFKMVDIKKGVRAHFKDIGQDPKHEDTTFENAQARYRTMTLMDKSNQLGALMVGTSDLSEIALGFSTFSGDHLSHYAVNSGVPKTLVRYLIDWVSEQTDFKRSRKVLLDILATPVSPELTRSKRGKISQVTEEIIGPYELHDFFLYNFLRFGNSPDKIMFLAKHAFTKRYKETDIKKWLRVFIKRFFANQWKRSVMPDGPKVGSIALSPRGDWRMPSDAEVREWL